MRWHTKYQVIVFFCFPSVSQLDLQTGTDGTTILVTFATEYGTMQVEKCN